MHLIISYYKSGNIDRDNEILFCIKKNSENKYINKIHILCENKIVFDEIKDTEKLVLHEIRSRPTFWDFLEYSRCYIGNEIIIIANSDIYFDESIFFTKKYLRKYDFITLTRWNILENDKVKFHNSFKSQDTWIFSGLISHDNIGRFYLGTPKCDNLFLHELCTLLHLKPINPSFKIKSYHLHLTNTRNYNTSLLNDFGPIKYILPSFDGVLHNNAHTNLKMFLKLSYRYYRDIYTNNHVDSEDRSIYDVLFAWVKLNFFAGLLKFFHGE